MTAEPLSLSPGDHLGRYEIVALLGTGGMGEVYRARDPHLHREVAVKVLQRTAASEEDVARFSREARAAGSLNHANIVAVFDVGTHAGIPYVVTELLEGETLRARLDRGPIPFRKAVDFGIQIAQALDAVHSKNIWHRDVKPANAFVTTDGRVKLLDFGIAKLGERQAPAAADDPTAQVGQTVTDLGTFGYMSPEQVLHDPADHRADIFAFGAVLYEMFTSTRAFKRGTFTEMRDAVLHEDPVDPLMLNAKLPPFAAAIVRRCLDKNKEERFQSARDLVFDLRQLQAQIESKPSDPRPAPRRRLLKWALVMGGVLAAAALAWILQPPHVTPRFDQLTFRRARIGSARFVSDGRAAVFSEAGTNNQLALSMHDLAENSPARPLGYPPDTDVVSSSSRGELALLMKRRFINGERFVGTLAIATPGSGAREQENNVEDAEWDASGTQMALVRSTRGMGGQSQLEYPVGTVRYTFDGSLRFPRVSRDGRWLAFLEDSAGGGEGGRVALLDLSRGGTPTVLTRSWKSVRGLAWSADGRELWFTAGDSRTHRALRAVTPRLTERVVFTAPGSLTLWDVAADGRVLLSWDEERRSLVGVAPGQKVERELSWFDDSGLADISDDGQLLLFSDRFDVYLRDTNGVTLPIPLGLNDAYADDLSPDAKWVLATKRTVDELVILPIGVGKRQVVPRHNIVSYSGARWLPGARRILFSGKETGRDLRSYIQDLDGSGAPRPLTPEHIWALSVSPSGDWAAAIGNDEPGILLWPIGGGDSRQVSGSQKGDRPVAFTTDGSGLWIFRRGEVPANIVKLDIATGRREIFTTLTPADVGGVYSITEFAISPDGRAYFYSYRRVLSQLFLVHGLK